MIKPVKIAMTHKELQVLLRIFEVDPRPSPKDDFNIIINEVVKEIAITLYKKNIDQKKNYKLTLKSYQAICLKNYLNIVRPTILLRDDFNYWDYNVIESNFFILHQKTLS